MTTVQLDANIFVLTAEPANMSSQLHENVKSGSNEAKRFHLKYGVNTSEMFSGKESDSNYIGDMVGPNFIEDFQGGTFEIFHKIRATLHPSVCGASSGNGAIIYLDGETRVSTTKRMIEALKSLLRYTMCPQL